MPLVRRVPKRGFNNIFRREYSVVNLARLEGFEGEINPETLLKRGLVRKGLPVQILGQGEVSKALVVSAHKFSKTAREKIEAAGGRCEVLEQ